MSRNCMDPRHDPRADNGLCVELSFDTREDNRRRQSRGNVNCRVPRSGDSFSFTLLWSSEHARPDDVIDINRLRIWSRDHLLFDAEFLDSDFGSNRYRLRAFARGTWLDVVASTLMLQFHEEGDSVRH
jgi:hypothetical protein